MYSAWLRRQEWNEHLGNRHPLLGGPVCPQQDRRFRLERGSFWGFLLISIVVSGLLLALIETIT
jgi:hypothetical protein